MPEVTKLFTKSYGTAQVRYARTLAMKPYGLVMCPLIFSEGRHYANAWLD